MQERLTSCERDICHFPETQAIWGDTRAAGEAKDDEMMKTGQTGRNRDFHPRILFLSVPVGPWSREDTVNGYPSARGMLHAGPKACTACPLIFWAIRGVRLPATWPTDPANRSLDPPPFPLRSSPSLPPTPRHDLYPASILLSSFSFHRGPFSSGPWSRSSFV